MKVGFFCLCIGFFFDFLFVLGYVKVVKVLLSVGVMVGVFVRLVYLCFGDWVGRVKERLGFYNGYR